MLKSLTYCIPFCVTTCGTLLGKSVKLSEEFQSN